ncbi:MAG: hypothetical protein HYU66_09495 [Armatimonadetes bacterium]|nr:hypothetical protein [Armatimonadota bacterium]
MTRRWRNVGWLAALVAAVCVGLSAGRAAADDVKPAAPATTEGATDTAPEPAATPAKPARAPSAEKPAAPPTATKPGMSEPAPAATAATGKPDAAPAERAIRADVALIPGRVSALLSIRGGPAHLQLNTSGVLLFWTTPAEAQWLSRVPTRDARSLSLVFPDVPHDPMAPMTSETTVTVPARPPLFRDVPHDPAAPAREPQPAASGEQDTLRDVPRDTDVFGLETATRQYQALNAWSRAARLPLALRTDGADLGLGEERAFELNLSDGGPRAYLEPQDGGLYRRIELVDRDGYQIILHVGREGNDVTVEMTRKAVVGGRLDEGTGAMVGKPSVVKTVCTLTAPLSRTRR